MEDQNGEIHLDTDEARGGTTPNIMRWVLGIGLLLAVIGMSLAWIIPSMSREGGDVSGVAAEQPAVGQETPAAASTGSSTDSIVGEDADAIDAAVPAVSSAAAAPAADTPAEAQ